MAPESLTGARQTQPEANTFENAANLYGWPQENERGYRIQERPYGSERPLRVIHIGAGISGICMAKLLPETLSNVSLVCYDKNDDIGGTWLENRYPGCACDIPSVNYQFTWARNPKWSQFYSRADEIWQYLKDTVDAYDLTKYMRLEHEVRGAQWDEKESVWKVSVVNLRTKEVFTDTAEILVNNSGVLNDWQWPKIEGLKTFKGKICHTARWDNTINLNKAKVAVIGMGSSGIQVTSEIADKVEHLYTWVRSPTWITAGFAQNWAGPNGANFEYSKEQQDAFRQNPSAYLEYCKKIESELNQRFKFILAGTPEAAAAKKFATDQMSARLGGDAELVDKLIPKTFNVGCRRPTPGNGFLEALVRPNVTAFTQGLKKIIPRGVVNEDGTEHEVDTIVCATGFNTTWVPRFPIVAHGKNVQDLLAGRPLSYLSIAMPDIPNYWMGVGPYGPLGHGSFIPIIELVTRHILKVVKKMQRENVRSLEPRRDACEAFTEHADLFLKRTAWSGQCRSWFKQGRLDGALSIFPGSRLVYMDLLAEPRYEDYRISYVGGNQFGFLGNGFSTKEFDGSDLAYYLGTDDAPGALLPENTNSTAKQVDTKANGVAVSTTELQSDVLAH
ncbi:putative sterigmatocystin biosynthesis monooxygenase stcW [Cyphellophora attinorum]|uniref:Putative sterigmatocystin biosynthesis monooxygenase stcW n=1 Tax=Cyphellophora attinorum TaxID=1664694 RepID=A0A0N0NPI9_9EURO|nr:putative sterigmatocystin biosynthesis monooxygenase stcW [Phialophora attinorum]KPI42778.1 putative sterigmatocystin biosynthesis monooxygenase stcW [Phialophora attinorum]